MSQIPGTNFELLSPNFYSMKVEAPSGGVVAGSIGLYNDTYGIHVNDADAGDEVVIVYKAEKLEFKNKATGAAINPGEAVFYETDGKVYGTDDTSRKMVGTCLETAASSATKIIMEFDGTLAGRGTS